MKDFLFEIGVEELPAKQLSKLGEALFHHVLEGFKEQRLAYGEGAKFFATPRRLAVFVPKLASTQEDQTLERKGPNLQNAFDVNGNPTKACEGFAKSCGLSVSDLETRETPQGKFLFAKQHVKGLSAEALLPDLIQKALDQLPISKPMHWGNHAKAFLRPVRWVLILLGKEVIPATFFDQTTQGFSFGHRFLVAEKIKIDEPKHYERLLEKEGKVIADFSVRQEKIREGLNAAAKKLCGEVCWNEALLSEVASLVEWPVVLTVSFDPRFLEVPDNALISSMEGHQKAFAVKKNGKLLPHFLTVSNVISKNEEEVMIGNARVMSARLSDAEFFYHKDLQTPLENYRDDLKRVVFQAQLGSLYAKTKALETMVRKLAELFGENSENATRAAALAKCDLRTQMVGEFPELQGEMGKIYAEKENYPKEVSSALFEQYLPRFAQDELPETRAGVALALADRFLNLVGIFGIGQIPSGEKDPFALRRAAIGICRIILDKRLDFDLMPILIAASGAWQAEGAKFSNTETIEKVYEFLMERLRFMMLEEGFSAQVIQAVLALNLSNILDIRERIHAVSLFQAMPEAASLVAAQKRVLNLLRKEALEPESLGELDPKLFQQAEEKALADALIEVQAKTEVAMQKRAYTEVLREMAVLKKPVDDFFDHVMVMAEDAKLKHNRLCLLSQLSKLMRQVAEINHL